MIKKNDFIKIIASKPFGFSTEKESVISTKSVILNDFLFKLTKIRDFLKDIINRLKNVFSTEEIKRWEKAERMWENAVKNAEVAERTGDVEYSFVKDNTENKVIDLSQDNNLTKLIGNEKGANKYKIIRDYILDVLSEQPITLSDGKTAIVDRSDALHIANRSANKKNSIHIRNKKGN